MNKESNPQREAAVHAKEEESASPNRKRSIQGEEEPKEKNEQNSRVLPVKHREELERVLDRSSLTKTQKIKVIRKFLECQKKSLAIISRQIRLGHRAKQDSKKIAFISRARNIRHRRPKKEIPARAICPECFGTFGTCESLKNHYQKTHNGRRTQIRQDGNKVIFQFVVPAERVQMLQARGWDIKVFQGSNKTIMKRIPPARETNPAYQNDSDQPSSHMIEEEEIIESNSSQSHHNPIILVKNDDHFINPESEEDNQQMASRRQCDQTRK